MLTIPRVAWTGGCHPTKSIKKTKVFKSLRRQYFRELVQNCGGLDLWKCAGSVPELARWNGLRYSGTKPR
jgi:hypothetical protein